MKTRLTVCAVLLVAGATLFAPLVTTPAEELSPAVEQLRHAAGRWDVTTEYLKPDGAVARSVEGRYEFDWVVPDRVLIGRALQPEPGQDSGILFYYQASTNTIGMSSVGADGQLWVMTGSADQEVRRTPPTPMADGSTIELRFTRYNVQPDRFESRMEYSTDGGATWVVGNQQSFRRSAAGATADRSAPPLTWETLAAHIEAAAAAGFSGAVLVVRDGAVLLDRGYGLANRELGLEITPETIFATGSLPIDYTHAAILWLAQAGKLQLSDPITKFFKQVPRHKRSITIEQLLTGASGLPDFHDVPGDRDPDHAWIDRDEALRRIFAQTLLFSPGASEQHSHSAWGVLAAIVEIAGGRSYQEFTREHLFGPAGMSDTGFNGDPVPAERLAIGYGNRSDGEINAPPYWGKTSWLVLGSGGQIGTTRDTGRWIEAMREGKILDPAGVRRYFGQGVSASRNGDVYGFEMFVFRTPDARSYVVTLTNANKPGDGDADSTPFARLSRDLGEFLLQPFRPRFRLGLGLDRGAGGVALAGRIVPGSAAERGGLREGDILLSAGGVAFGDDPLAVLEPYLQSGDAVHFLVRRDGREVEIVVKPDPR